MSVAAPLWFWKIWKKILNLGIFSKILKTLKKFKILNYNFQSRKQILTLRGVYQPEKNRLWNQYILIKKFGVLMSCLKAVQHPNHLSPFLRRCPHDRGRVERLGVMSAGHQPGCPRLNLETQRRFFGMVTAPYAPLQCYCSPRHVLFTKFLKKLFFGISKNGRQFEVTI